MGGDCRFFVQEAGLQKPTMADRLVDMLAN